MTRPDTVSPVVTMTPGSSAWANDVVDGVNAIAEDIYGPDPGDPLELPWASLTGVPATFAPADHATEHATGGGDVLTADQVGGFLRQAAGGTIGTRIYVGTGTPGAGADPDPAEGDVWIKG